MNVQKSQNLVMMILETTKPFNLCFFGANFSWEGGGRQIRKRVGGGEGCEYINGVIKFCEQYH